MKTAVIDQKEANEQREREVLARRLELEWYSTPSPHKEVPSGAA